MPRQRRTRGTGSITWDKSRRRWIARFRSETIIKRSFTTKAAAERFLSSLQADQRDNISLTPPTVSAWMQSYLSEIRVKPSTMELYQTINKDRIIPYLGKYRLSDLTVTHINRWIAKLQQRYAYTSTRNSYRLLSQALGEAVNRDLLRKNPCSIKLRSHSPARPSVALTVAQGKKLLAVAQHHRLYALYALALTTGMRIGELIALRWENVDLENQLIKIEETVRVIKKETIVSSPKTRSSKRSIPIPDDVLPILLEHQRRMQVESKKWKGKRFDLVFPSSNGTVILHSVFTKSFKILLKKADLPNIRFHDLRHTATSIMLSNHTSALDVSSILGHKSLNITMGIYAHSYDEQKRDAVEGLSGVLIRDIEGENNHE